MTGTEPRTFRVVWQAPDGTFWRVGWLRAEEATSGLAYRFGYEPRAALPSGFEPFLAFPELDQVVESDELFSFFTNRVLSPRAPSYAEYLTELGLDVTDATPVEMLARTLGRRMTDTVQVVPAPVVQPDGMTHQRFLVSGVRHIARDRRPDVSDVIGRLTPGTELRLVDDFGNDADPRAVLVDDRSGPLGWVPQYLLEEFHKARSLDERAVRCIVVHANGPEAPWHFRLLCDLERPALESDERA